MTAPSAIPVFGGQVPRARIDLTGDAGVGPPPVGLAQEEVPVIQRRVEQRHRQPCTLADVAEVPFGRGPDAVGHLGENRTERRGAPNRPGLQLLGQLADCAPAELNRIRDDSPDVSQLGVLYRSTAYGTVGLPASVTLTPDSTRHYLLLTYNSPNGLVSGWIDHGKLRFLPARHPNSELLITAW
jgi:hypothetical protein